MEKMEFMYKGKQIVIEHRDPHSVVSVDGREFECHHHHAKSDEGLSMWMCEETYFASPDIRELARHFADYGYMFDDPNRVLVNDTGEVIPVAKKGAKQGKGRSKKGDGKTSDSSGHNDHGKGGGH